MATAKPIMRGFLVRRFKRDMIGTVIFSSIMVAAHQLLVAQPRKRKYEEFYKTYDAEADFQRMHKAGVFNYGIPPTTDDFE